MFLQLHLTSQMFHGEPRNTVLGHNSLQAKVWTVINILFCHFTSNSFEEFTQPSFSEGKGWGGGELLLSFQDCCTSPWKEQRHVSH